MSAATLPGDLPDIAPTADRLFANQVEIGNAIKPFYGDAAGNRLTQLLTDHIAIAADARASVASASASSGASRQPNGVGRTGAGTDRGWAGKVISVPDNGDGQGGANPRAAPP